MQEKMKKWISGGIVVCMVALLAACGSSSEVQSEASQGTDASQAGSTPSSVSTPQADPSSCSITFQVPEGFEEMDASQYGVSEMYQTDDGSNINVVIVENVEGSIDYVTQDVMVSSLEQGFEEQTGTAITLNDVEFTKYEIGPCPAYRMSYNVELNGVTMTQTMIGVSADMAYTITFTDMTNGTWAEVFAQAADSITAVEA